MATRSVASLALAASALAAAALAADPSPPLLGPVVTAPFNQTIRVAGFEFDNYVDFFYDATTTPVGSSLSAHHQGQHDEICTGVQGKYFSEEPCSLLDSADGWLYVVYPQSKTCCRACNTTAFCGIIASNWLQDNATYVGTSTIRGVDCDGWVKVGGEQNFWYTTVASRNDKFARQPCQYDEGYPTFDKGSNYCGSKAIAPSAHQSAWPLYPHRRPRAPFPFPRAGNFTYSAWSTSAIPASTFAIPQGMGCEQDCKFSEPRTPEAYAERLAARYAAGSKTLRKL